MRVQHSSGRFFCMIFFYFHQFYQEIRTVGTKNTGVHKSRANKFCKVTPKMYSSSVRSLLVTCRSNTRDPEHCLQSEGWNSAQKNPQQILVFWCLGAPLAASWVGMCHWNRNMRTLRKIFCHCCESSSSLLIQRMALFLRDTKLKDWNFKIVLQTGGVTLTI
jgi:hypothetical protein